MKKTPINERFWTKVKVGNPDECWNWIASKDKWGYGHIDSGGKLKKSNRVAWILTYGEIPDGMLVLHKCDNPACCNPNHLFLGTNQDNVDDMIRKGRKANASGENNGRAILTEKDVIFIRNIYSTGQISMSKLGKKFGVAKRTIFDIIHYRNWPKVGK